MREDRGVDGRDVSGHGTDVGNGHDGFGWAFIWKILLINNFKIISTSKSKLSLLILESLYIKYLSPPLNSATTSTPLLIA